MIKPVQRIPRYVLFIKDLLKQTPQLHPDRQLLSQALEEMTTLAELMNESEQEAHRMDQLREFVSNIEGAPNVCLQDAVSITCFFDVNIISSSIHLPCFLFIAGGAKTYSNSTRPCD